MKPYEAFVSKFGGRKIAFNQEYIVEKNNRFYFLNPRLKKMPINFYYAGLYLGKTKNGVFFPSFNLLNFLVGAADNKVVVNGKAAWLFVCGRDIFHSGLLRVMGSKQKGDATLVLNEFGECLGFGKIIDDLDGANNKVAIQNVLDVGDFLRRERNR